MVIEEPRPKKRQTIITYILIIICIVMFIITLGPTGLILNESSPLVQNLWFKSAYFFDPIYGEQGQNLHSLITAAFLHGDWIHITSNMYFLWVFGDDSEDIMGRVTFVIFFIFCAIIASAFFALVNIIAYSITLNYALLSTPAVGASGAIFGVLAAYAIFFPNRTLMVPGWGRVSAKYYIIIYAIFETVYIFIGGDNVAHSAHVGGFLAGVFFAFMFRKLFQEKYQIAKTVFLPAGHKTK
ncbi:MAG: rhomboid family intramembrane serine protease [Candidatus Helarchaeota archaeon]|nr:rhomboid family intramembrane serine protease [Candidatus Helarchaeota archaeon]